MAAAGSAAASPQPAAAAASPQRSPSPNDGLTPAEREHRRRLEYNEEDAVGADGYDDDDDHAGPGAAQMVHTEEVIAQIPLANFSVPAGGKVWHARMPHFLQVATGAFDEETWEPEDVPQGAGRTAAAGGQQESQDAASQDEVKPRTVPDENVIRWRWTKDELGQAVRFLLPPSRHGVLPSVRRKLMTDSPPIRPPQIKQSNARIVRWSDGTLSLQLGSELFDMTLALDDSATLTATGAASAAGSGGVNPQTSGLVPSAFDLARGHGLTYLSARHTYAGTPLSETQASVHGTMSFRPATLASQTHRRLAGSIAGRYGRNQASRRGTQKAEMPTVDPEKARQQRERAEVERQKKARREAVKAAGGGATRSGGRGRAGKKATTIEGLDLGSDEDDEDDEDGEGMRYDSGYRRSQPKRGKSGPLNRDYDDDDDGFLAQSDESVPPFLFLLLATAMLTTSLALSDDAGRWKKPAATAKSSKRPTKPPSAPPAAARTARSGATTRPTRTTTTTTTLLRVRVRARMRRRGRRRRRGAGSWSSRTRMSERAGSVQGGGLCVSPRLFSFGRNDCAFERLTRSAPRGHRFFAVMRVRAPDGVGARCNSA